MQPSELSRAVAATRSTLSALGLSVDDAIVLHNSNKLALRLLPCDVMARVAPAGQHCAQFEIELAQRLADVESPVARLDARLEPRVHHSDDFAITFWTYYEPAKPSEVDPTTFARVLGRLHRGMRAIDLPTPHFTDRVIEAQQLIDDRDQTPDLTESDRALINDVLHEQTRAILARSAADQLLHGEPHPGNLLSTADGPLFIDFETCCRGPVEFDLAHVPAAVSDRYPDADQALVGECRMLVLAMVAAWRWDRADEFPDGRQAGQMLIRALRAGPPAPGLDIVMTTPGATR